MVVKLDKILSRVKLHVEQSWCFVGSLWVFPQSKNMLDEMNERWQTMSCWYKLSWVIKRVKRDAEILINEHKIVLMGRNQFNIWTFILLTKVLQKLESITFIRGGEEGRGGSNAFCRNVCALLIVTCSSRLKTRDISSKYHYKWHCY